MLSVIEIIKRLFPTGTGRKKQVDWDQAPVWPPDVFAAAGTLIRMSGCYTLARYTCHGYTHCFFNSTYVTEVSSIAKEWGGGAVPKELQRLWASLLVKGRKDILDYSSWSDTAMKLLSISDEASAGVGFVGSEASVFADYVFEQHALVANGKKATLPYIPYSHCMMIPPTEACVQPKTMTPKVGCTLRSLSHHLALLPPRGEVETNWVFWLPLGRSSEEPLNILLVPFPFHIDGRCFSTGSATALAGQKLRFLT
jgi:hypothetical protein